MGVAQIAPSLTVILVQMLTVYVEAITLSFLLLQQDCSLRLSPYRDILQGLAKPAFLFSCI